MRKTTSTAHAATRCKKVISLFLVFTLFLGFFPITTFADTIVDSGTCGDNLTWALDDNGTLTISGEGEMDKYLDWNSRKDEIVKVVMENGITTISESAFSFCTNLESIAIPNSVISIGSNAFGHCKSLTSMTIPSSVSEIDSSAFGGCTALQKITVDKDNKHYFCDSYGALLNMDATQIIAIPCNIVSYCVPSSVTAIPNGVFANHYNLTQITLSNINTIGVNAFAGCSSLKSIIFPSGLKRIETWSFSGCENLSVIIFTGDAPSDIGFWMESMGDDTIYRPESVFEDVIATAYYPASNDTWTEEFMSADYGGELTWIPYNEGETPWESDTADPESTEPETTEPAPTEPEPTEPAPTEPKSTEPAPTEPEPTEPAPTEPKPTEPAPTEPEPTEPAPTELEADRHETIQELTDVDYLAFSEICYFDFDGREGDTLQSVLMDLGKWNKKFAKSDIKYSELCAGIAMWKVADVWNFSDISGFYGVAFENEKGEAVIAYRGSVPLGGLKDLSSDDAISDWIVNDLPSELLGLVFDDGQYLDAITMCEAVMKQHSEVVVTGHSLGGGLADLVAAHMGCKGVSMNAISILDAVYMSNPALFATSFQGVDKWNFVDHANQYDMLAGSFEHYFSTKIKPVTAHRNNGKFDIANIAAYHGMDSLLTRDADGDPTLLDVEYTFRPNAPITSYTKWLGLVVGVINFGTSKADRLITVLPYQPNITTSYGGDGFDLINTGINNDFLIGGTGSDELDGSFGDDRYIYCKGDGVDTIHDIGGNDILYLIGFNEDDTFSVREDSDSDYIEVRSNGKTIVKISKKNREYSLFTTNSFEIVVDYGTTDSTPTSYDITDAFYKFTCGEHLYIGCPVNIEIVDSDENVVYTLKDGEIGNYYTDYGNFYIFEEEDGGYGKVIDLLSGYSARIVGIGEGSMDISYQVVTEGVLSNPITLTDVPVTDSVVATFVTNADGNICLSLDTDNDGTADESILLEGQHTHEWDEGTVVKEATCIENGEMTYICATCDETRIETIPAMEHSFEFVVIAPNCTEKGYTIFTCSVCGDSYTDVYIDATGHFDSNGDGQCDDCNAECGVPTQPTEEPQETQPTEDNKHTLVWVVIPVMLLAGLSVFLLIWKKKKSGYHKEETVEGIESMESDAIDHSNGSDNADKESNDAALMDEPSCEHTADGNPEGEPSDAVPNDETV